MWSHFVHSVMVMVCNRAWSLTSTGTSEILAEIPRDNTDFCEDGQTLSQVAKRAYGVSVLGRFKTRWNSSPSNLFQLTLVWAGDLDYTVSSNTSQLQLFSFRKYGEHFQLNLGRGRVLLLLPLVELATEITSF